jgi:hypothetical protein
LVPCAIHGIRVNGVRDFVGFIVIFGNGLYHQLPGLLPDMSLLLKGTIHAAEN